MHIARVVEVLDTVSLPGHSVNIPHYSGTGETPVAPSLPALAGKLDAFDPDKHYLAIFVWPDSFEHFGVIRDLMVQKHFEYRLVPFPADGKIYIGPAEGDVIVF